MSYGSYFVLRQFSKLLKQFLALNIVHYNVNLALHHIVKHCNVFGYIWMVQLPSEMILLNLCSPFFFVIFSENFDSKNSARFVCALVHACVQSFSYFGAKGVIQIKSAIDLQRAQSDQALARFLYCSQAIHLDRGGLGAIVGNEAAAARVFRVVRQLELIIETRSSD